MLIHQKIKEITKHEKRWTAKLLNKLVIVEKEKLYCDLKYPSLFKYIVKELGYSDSEARVRVGAVKLMLKSKKAKTKIENGDLNLTNAAAATSALEGIKNEKKIQKIVELASEVSTRKFEEIAPQILNKPRKRTATITLDEETITQFDKLRIQYGEDLSNYELIKILLQEKLKIEIHTYYCKKSNLHRKM
jgi:hypothetical protein